MDVQSQQPLVLTVFVQLCLAGKVLEEYEIRSPVVSLGRSSDCDITIDNVAVSSFHALLSQRDGKLFIEDAASTNGVMFENSKITTVELRSGESVDIAGKYSLRMVEVPEGAPTRVSAKNPSPEDQQKETIPVDTSTLNIRVGGWLSPALIATIECREGGYYLQVEPGCDVSVDDRSVPGEYRRLQEGSRLRFKKLGGVFHERTRARSR